jgi:DNA-binding NarL/FixJ family response regulator
MLVDDEAEVREAFRDFFARQTEFTLVGEVPDGRAAVAAWRQLRPQVTLMDLQMPGISGVDAIKLLCREDPGVCVVALTAFGTHQHVVAALRAGASGYVLKGCGPSALTQAIRDAHMGRMPLSPGVRLALVDSIREPGWSDPSQWSASVTDAEMEILRCLAAGLSAAQISERLKMAEPVVHGHLGSLTSKLNAGSPTEIVIKALQLGIIDLEAF